jgi:thiol-disulfide isomerase/thioredoxin
MKSVRLFLAAAFFLAVAASAPAAEPSAPAQAPAGTAEKAPAAPETLSAAGLPSDWVQGGPVRAFEPGKLYVFEFWATWCGPCLAMIPHMNEIHGRLKDNKDVVIVGVNVYDKTPVAKITDFLAKRPVRPEYAIAADRGALATEKNWLKPLGVTGIPFAVALKDGKILWKGHPQGLSAELVERMAKPGYSPADEAAARAAAEAAKKEHARQVREVRHLLRQGKNAEADALIGRIVADPAADEDLLCSVLEAPFMPRLLAGDPAGAQQALQRMAETMKANDYAQIRVAHCILTTDELAVKDKDLKLAVACLERCYALRGGKDPAPLEQIADAKFLMGDRAGAVAAQEKSVRGHAIARRLVKLEGEAALDAFLAALPAVPAPKDETIAPQPGRAASAAADSAPDAAPPALGEPLSASLLAHLEWLQGAAVDAWEPGKLYFLDLWIPPAPGPADFDQKTRGPLGQARKRLGKLLDDPAFRPVVAVVFGSAETRARALDVLKRPAFRTPHPVALDDGTVLGWMEALKIKGLPACLIVKDGRLLWAGEAGDLNPDVIGAMLRPDYDFAKETAAAAARKETATAAWKRLGEARELAQAKKFDEAEALCNELAATPDLHPGVRMMVDEARFGIAFRRGGAAAGLAVLQEALDKHPEDGYVADRVFKYVTGTAELKEIGRPLAIRAALAMAEAHADDPDYAAACWGGCVGSLREEGGDKAGAGEAYRKGLALSSACRRLQELRALAAQPVPPSK